MRVLLVASRCPLPAWRGNQVRTVEWLEALADHDLVLLCPAPAKPAPLVADLETRFYRVSIVARGLGMARAALKGRPFQEGLYSTADADRALSSVLREWRPDVVVVQMVRCAWAADLIRSEAPSTPIVFDAIDSMGLHFSRAAQSSIPPLSTLYAAESRRCQRLETRVAGDARISVAVSKRDLESLSVAAERGRVIPVAGREVRSAEGPALEPSVVLTGNLGYRPTVRGAMWFAAKVWPGVRAAVPDARWVVAGARPVADIRRLALQPGVEIHADVPDLEPYLTAARVAIAPMSSGSGVPMKVLEALAAGVPTVAHPWAADGLVRDGRDAVAVASDAQGWVDAVARLLTDDQAAAALARRGREVWRRFYHPDVIAQQIRDVVDEAARN
jgi:glycosyltransferase involved in cell wall biosynthesis